MIFNSHSELQGRHAFLSASKHSWTNYDNEKLETTYRRSVAAQRGSELHDLAYNLIRLGVKLPSNQKTLNRYVNDALGFRMVPEQILYYSENCFGTADAISYKRGLLRIHDLKTGVTPTSMRQLEVYVAIFCLEYNVKPADIKTELRIYQNDETIVHIPELDTIVHIMDKIKTFDSIITVIRAEELL